MNQPQTSSWAKLLPRLACYLPAGQFNQLRALPEKLEHLEGDENSTVSRDLLAAIRTLDPLHRVLVEYMPRYLIELDPTPGQPHGQLLEGTFIFADVTGFTALTELLARQGQARGRELMNQIMNRLFTEILEALIASAGDLLIFAGDAALVYFPKQENGEDVLQATRAALRMERAIVPFASFETEYGHCSLTMSAGVERGLAYGGVVGTPRRMELLISGPGIDGAMQAETRAEPGQVMLGEQARAVAHHHFTMQGGLVIDDLGQTLGDYEISLPARKRGGAVFMGMDIPEILTAVETSLQRVERLAPFLPEDMLAHLVNTDRQRKLASEFRPVAAQFIHIVGLETLAIRQGAKLATAVLQRYFVRAEEIITQHEGVISQVDAYAQGFFLLNTFGTPKAHEGTTRYAVSAALQLAKALEQINREFKLDPPLKQRGGITYGLVFNGEVGAKYRRESVVAGPAVNRAARLMSKAQFGQVILDTEIWEDTRNAFVGEELPSVKLKGIEGQVVIVNVHELRRGTRLQPLERPLLGREVEQTRLAQAREALLYRQQGSAWLVYGETGLGKSSLILDLAQKAQQHGLTILAGRCQPHAKNIPLFVWTDLLTGWLDVDESADPAKERVRLAAQLELLGIPEVKTTLVELLALPENGEKAPATRIREPQMPRPQRPVVKTSGTLLSALNRKVGTATKDEGVAKSPGLNTLLGSRLAQTTQNGPTLWKRLEERVTGPAVIIKLIQQLARKQPLLLILEDVHWLDCESEAVLHKLLAQTPELPLLLVLTSRKSFDQPNLSSLELSRLSASAITQVAQRAFGAQALDGSLAEWICNQANGNPLYAEELCQALRQADAVFLDRGAGEVHWTKQAPDLPLSLHELMLARLDELPLPQQDMLKRAAVIGVSFEAEALQRLSAGRLAESDLQSSLERVIQEGFVVETQPQNYRFNHPLMQEAIYTTLSFSQRQIWHTEIGHWLMERRPDLVELIAYHYLRGDDAPKAAQAALKAGHKAQEQGAYTGALEYYEQVLALPTVSIEAKMTATERQGDILMVQKDYSAAKQAYAQAIIWGSRTALAKQAILMGDLEGLGLVEFPAPLRPWAEASRAWLLAQNRQPDLALQSAQAAVALAEGSAQEILRTLLQSLEKQEPMASYEEWLYQFSQLNLLK